MNNWPKQDEASMNAFFGDKGENTRSLILPFPMRVAWDKKVLINKFAINVKCHDSAQKAFAEIAKHYPDPRQRAELGLDLWGGCLNVRKMRGGNKWSIHSWGCAIDFDPERNQLKWGADRARLAKQDCITFWKIWENQGWVSLGRARNYDWMHVQAARL